MKYFFSLYVLFLSVCGNLYANANQSQKVLTFEETINQIESIDITILQKDDVLKPSFFYSVFQKENDLICTTDSEIAEEETETSSKKNSLCNIYYKFDASIQNLESQHQGIKKRYSQNKFFEYYTTIKINVLLGVYLI